jgi:hypothetical protein
LLQNVKVELKQVQLALDSVDWLEQSTGREPSAEELKSVTDRVNKVVQDVANAQAQAAMPPAASRPQLPPSMPLASPWQMQMQMGSFRPGAVGLPGMQMGGMLGMGGLPGGLPGMPPTGMPGMPSVGGGPMDFQATIAALNDPTRQAAACHQAEEEASTVPAGASAAFDMEAVRRLAQQAEEEEDRQEQEEEEARELEKRRAVDAARVQAEIDAKIKVDRERYDQMRHQQQAAAASAAARQIEQSRARHDGRRGDDSGDDMEIEAPGPGSTLGGSLPPQSVLPPLPGHRLPMQGLQVAPPGIPPLPPPTAQSHWTNVLANRSADMPGADGIGHVPKAVPPPGPGAFGGGFMVAPPRSASSGAAAAIAAQFAGDLSSTLAGQLASSAALKAQGFQKKQVSVADAFNPDAEDTGGLAGAMAAAAKKQVALPVGGLAAAAANMGFGSAQVEKRSRSRSRRNRRPSPVPVQRRSSNFDIGPGGAPLPGLEAPAPHKPAAKSRSKDRKKDKDRDRDRDRDRKKQKSRSRSRSRDRRKRDRSFSRHRASRAGGAPQSYGGRPAQSDFWPPGGMSRGSPNETAIEMTGGITEGTSRLGLKRTMENFGVVEVCHMGNRAVDLPFVRYKTVSAFEAALNAL